MFAKLKLVFCCYAGLKQYLSESIILTCSDSADGEPKVFSF